MKKTFNIYGLDCMHCAHEVEEHLNNDENILSASIDFLNKKLFVEFKNEYSLKQLEDRICEVEKVTLSQNEVKKKGMTKENLIILFKLLVQLAFLVPALLLDVKIGVYFYILAYIVGGYQIVINTFKAFKRKSFFNESLLMFVATIGALIIGEYLEANLVLLFYQIGEFLQDFSLQRSKNSIISAFELKNKQVVKIVDGIETQVDVEKIIENDEIKVVTGDVIPVDGVVLSGNAEVNTSSITGEFIPVDVNSGSELKAGYSVISGSLIIKVTNKYADSTVSKIINLISTSNENKSQSEKLITKFAKVYTPIVFSLALLMFVIPVCFGGEVEEFLYRALTFLVISCPCAVVISVPLAYFTAIGLFAKKGIMVNGGNVVDKLCEVDCAVFDKTGTLTRGRFSVCEIVTDLSEEEVLAIAAHAESVSNHPIAKSIIEAYGKQVDCTKVSELVEEGSLGVVGKYLNENVVVGSIQLLKKYGIVCPEERDGKNVFVCLNEKVVGQIVLKDEVRENSSATISSLNDLKIESYMFTGDGEQRAKEVASAIKLDNIKYSMLPQDKAEGLKELESENKKVLYVGDGINDIPCMKSAFVSFAMGGGASDVVCESADAVIMNEDVKCVSKSIKIAKKVKKRVIFNLIIALLVKVVVLVLSAFGITNMLLALLSDVGLSVVLIISSLLLFNIKVD